MKNIVLVGMPSCGKTTIGRIIAEITGMQFLDTDEVIEKNLSMSVSEIISTKGESFFRKIETEAIIEASKNNNTVISCGGGVPLKKRNVAALKKKGFIVWIKRDVRLLSTDGRPLSKNLETLKKMEKERVKYYNRCADFSVTNDDSLTNMAKRIIRGYNENRDN